MTPVLEFLPSMPTSRPTLIHPDLFDKRPEEIKQPSVQPEPPLAEDMQQLYEHIASLDPFLFQHNAKTLHHVLADSDAVDMIRFVQRSKLAQWFSDHAHLYLSVPASSYNYDLPHEHQHHDCHTHGLMVHYARMYASIVRDMQSGANIPPPRYSLEDMMMGIWLHDAGKIFTYARIGTTNWWTYRKHPEDEDQADLIADALYESNTKLEKWERRLLAFQLLGSGTTMQLGKEDDAAYFVKRADGAAERTSESVAWTGANLLCPNRECGHTLKLNVPRNLGRGDELFPVATYECPRKAHKTKCTPRTPTDAFSVEESRQFHEKFRIMIPLTANAAPES